MKGGAGRELERRAGSPKNVQTTIRLNLYWFRDQLSHYEVCSGLWLRRRLGLPIEGVFRFSPDSIERLLHLEHRELDVFFQSR